MAVVGVQLAAALQRQGRAELVWLCFFGPRVFNMKYARIVSNAAVDVRTESPEGCFTPDIAAQFVTVPDQVEDGWTINEGVWSAPAIPEPVVPPAPVVIPPKVSPVEFMLLFKSPERIAIKAARPTDPVIDDFMDIVEDTRLTFVDLGLQSTQDALNYFVFKTILTPERKDQILTGQAQ